jgi:hypothetical protein
MNPTDLVHRLRLRAHRAHGAGDHGLAEDLWAAIAELERLSREVMFRPLSDAVRAKIERDRPRSAGS